MGTCFFCSTKLRPSDRCRFVRCQGRTISAHARCYGLDQDGNILTLTDILPDARAL